MAAGINLNCWLLAFQASDIRQATSCIGNSRGIQFSRETLALLERFWVHNLDDVELGPFIGSAVCPNGRWAVARAFHGTRSRGCGPRSREPHRSEERRVGKECRSR